MLQTFKNAWKTPELKKKLLFTALIIVLYRIGANLYVPYVNINSVQNLASLYEGSIFQFVSLLSGDAFSKATLFALSVSPYITASIVMQLLTIAIPALERLSKQGAEGQKKINAMNENQFKIEYIEDYKEGFGERTFVGRFHGDLVSEKTECYFS